MASTLENFTNKIITVITGDGRNIVGLLKGFDQTINLILEDSHERVFSSEQGVEQVPLGLYIIRGDNVCVAVLADGADARCSALIGEIDEDIDRRLDFPNIKAEPLAAIWLV